MSHTKGLADGLIKKGFVSEDCRQELEKYLRARDMFNDLFGDNDDFEEILGDLFQSQHELRRHISHLMSGTEECGHTLENSISFVREIEEKAVSCLDVLDKSLQSGLKQKSMAIYELADKVGRYYSGVYRQAEEINRYFQECTETLTELKELFIEFEKEMLKIKKLLTDNNVGKKDKSDDLSKSVLARR